MQNMVRDAIGILDGDNVNIGDIGKLLHENWKLKKSLTDKITNNSIDEIYQKAVVEGSFVDLRDLFIGLKDYDGYLNTIKK